MFSARLIKHKNTHMLNICDSDLIGKTLKRDNFSLKIKEEYYADKIVEKESIKVENNEIEETAKNQIRYQLASSGIQNPENL